jgi:stage V sporulation protein AD
MSNKLGDQTIVFNNRPQIISSYSVVGEKEGNGPFKEYFNYILDDDLFGDSQFDIEDLDADGFQDLSFDDGSMF